MTRLVRDIETAEREACVAAVLALRIPKPEGRVERVWNDAIATAADAIRSRSTP